MSEVNFNMVGIDKISNVLYHTNGNGSYGYRAIVNGCVIPISNIETVQGLQKLMPDITVAPGDVFTFEQAVTKEDTTNIKLENITGGQS